MFVTLVMSDCLVLNPTHQIKFDQRAVEDNRCHCLTEWLECELLAINMILTILTQANYSNVNLLQQIKASEIYFNTSLFFDCFSSQFST